MPIINKLLVSLCCFVLTSTAYASTVGVLELQQVFENYAHAEAVRQEIAAEFSPRQTLLQGKQAEVELKIRTHEKNKAIMSPEAISKEEQEILALRRAYQEYGQQLQKDLDRVQQTKMAAVEQLIEKAVEKVALKKGFDLVVFQGIAYHSPDMNITAEVLEELNSQSEAN